MYRIVVAFVLLGSWATMGQNVCDLVVDTVAAPQKTAPVRVVKTLVTENDYGAEVEVLNTTHDDVLEVQLGWTIESPSNCGNAFTPEVVIDQPESMVLHPGMMYPTFQHRISHQSIGAKMVNGGVHKLNIQIGVVHVRFRHEKDWDYPLKELGSFDNHAYTKATACKTECQEDRSR